MAKKKTSKRSRIAPKSSRSWLTDPSTLIVLLLLLASIVITVVASMNSTRPFSFAACNDSNCANVKNGSYWMITNCTNVSDPDGDQQLCNTKGRVGTCRGKSYCCPSAGAQWTTVMTACATPTAVPTATRAPTATLRPTYTPYPTSTPRPTNTPYPTSTRYPTNTPYPTSTRYPTNTPRPTNTPYPTYRPGSTSTPRPTSGGGGYTVPTSTIASTVGPTATPIPALSEVCGKSCSSDGDCQLGLTCTTVFAVLKACRNRLCTDKPGCLCDDQNGSFAFATPTPGPGGSALRTLPLTIGNFTDKKGQTGETPTITGVTEPDAKVTITVYPDGVGGEVYADKNGKWSYKFTKKLTPGPKNLLIVATKPDGQMQATKTFTVVGGGGFNFGWIIMIMVMAAVGFGVYVYVKSNQ